MGRIVAGAACLLIAPILAWSSHHHSITLKNGNTYHGQFVSGSGSQIVFEDENGSRRRFNLSDVATLNFESTPAATDASSRDASSTRRATTRDRARRSTADRSAAVREIPAGTEIAVRTNERIQSESSAEGRTYDADVYKDVVDQTGAVIIPRGADAQLIIREVKEGGTVSSPELLLDLQSVSFDGRRYLLSTEDLSQSGREGIGKNRRTAEMVGGGAALGGLLGAIAGGGKGAVIGAIAGAAAGGTVQVLTKGKEVRVPAETVLTFQVDQPVHLELMR